ncbi:hemicentin-1 isoform X2 [Ictalurus punctatus]|uniref:Hemicentin-1 isoform X2 n=1 Tax=Ictalurus punctatus TaxID=7998 RepID=A0A9F7TDS9_ICTPU|nr:hemicentin-1 isoform X2 [Ictalurus punctatus]
MLDHTSQRDLFGILLPLLCFCLVQIPGTCAANSLQPNLPSTQPAPNVTSAPLNITDHSDCPIKIQPVKLVVEFGDSVSANCSTTITHEGMGWEASDGGVDMMQMVQNITWRVESLTHWDMKPICYINVNSVQCELGPSVTVYKHPDRVSISTVNHTGPMIEGREYELQCDVQNVAPVHLLTVSWYKGQHLVKRENFSDKSPFPFNKTTTLQISPSRDDEGVQYRCEAELNLGPEGPQPPPKVTSDPLNITVYFGPELSNCPGVVHLNEGASLAGYCLVTGKPFPDFYWKREESVFDPTTPLNRNSSGEYKIIINKNVTSLTVEVIYGPEISCGHHFIVQEDTYFTPNCTVNGFPQITENWYKDEDDILSGFPRTMYRNAAGNYTLIASNNYSNVSHVIQIEVWYPPSEISELQNENVSIGKDVVLKCVSYANPRPSYRWIYHQTSNVRIVDEDGVSRLHITNADGENTGTYMCIVTNVLGIKNKAVRVDVQGAKAACPLSINPQPVVLAYGSSHNVTCESSVPSASLSWKYADKVLNESTLVINSNLFTDMLGWSGKASCLGHFVGLDDCQKDLNVIIYKRPDKVSISASSHAEPMIEGENYTLQCNIQNVAPVQFLTVNWYKGQDLVKSETDFETKDLSTINTTLVISPSRKDNKKQYSCETVLKLGPQSLCENKSDPLNIAVHYKPAITDKLPPRVPVFHGYPVVLICEASGYPEPSVAWIVNNNRFEGGNLTVKDNGGDYTCIANNSVGSDTRVVQVVQKDVSCKLVLKPPELLVKYGASASVDCSTATPSNHTGMGWEASQGAVGMMEDVQLITWKVDNLVHWEIQPVCFVNTLAGQCQIKLPVTVYKFPDQVSISTVGHTGPLIEGKQYELQCDVHNVAPVDLLTVNWYKGQHLVAKTSFSDSTKTPVNQSTRFHISLSRADDGVRYRCEAELKLSRTKAGTQVSSKVASQVLGLTVHYRPQATSVVEIFNETTKVVALNCTVKANPPPRYTWSSTNLGKEFNIGHPVLNISSMGSGNYTCTASNGIGSVSKLFVVKTKPRGMVVRAPAHVTPHAEVSLGETLNSKLLPMAS